MHKYIYYFLSPLNAYGMHMAITKLGMFPKEE